MAYSYGPPPEEASLQRSIESHRDVYATFDFAAEHNLLEYLNSSWRLQAKFERFLADTSAEAQHMCFIYACGPGPGPVAFRLAAQQIAAQEPYLQNQTQYPVVFISPPQGQPAAGYDGCWKALMKDVVTKLRPLSRGKLKVRSDDDPDTCLQAVERLKRLASPAQPVRHYCFLAGLDGAYDLKTGFNLVHDRSRVPPEDVARRERVARLVRALARLFGNRAFGKLVFCVGAELRDSSYLVNGERTIGMQYEELAYWQWEQSRMPKRVERELTGVVFD
ncbi:hypothetical protein F4801DRAFT_471907 [Xylaria longipes]|nr:hypothetical protein F4801DRAFT_471907 [Xylaria longipes]